MFVSLLWAHTFTYQETKPVDTTKDDFEAAFEAQMKNAEPAAESENMELNPAVSLKEFVAALLEENGDNESDEFYRALKAVTNLTTPDLEEMARISWNLVDKAPYDKCNHLDSAIERRLFDLRPAPTVRPSVPVENGLTADSELEKATKM